MTGTDDTDDGSTGSLISRRAVIAALGAGTVGVGVAGKTGLIDLDSGGPGTGGEKPPLNESAADPSTPSGPTGTPWDRDEVVVSIELQEERSGGANALNKYGRAEVKNAVDWWNDYIAETGDFDLTLTFDSNPDDADVLFQLMSGRSCTGEYQTPVSDNYDLGRTLCAETLTETPVDEDLPRTVLISKCGAGRSVYRTVAKHGIGRNLGYDVWSDPVDVMTPKRLFKPDWELDTETFATWLSEPWLVSQQKIPRLIEESEGNAQNLQSMDGSSNGMVQNSVRSTRRNLTSWIGDFNGLMEERWVPKVEGAGVSLYIEAYEETILNDEIAYVEDTIAVCDVLLNSEKDIVGTDDFNTLIDRLETIAGWTVTPFDFQIHRYFTDTHWTAWENGTGDYAE